MIEVEKDGKLYRFGTVRELVEFESSTSSQAVAVPVKEQPAEPVKVSKTEDEVKHRSFSQIIEEDFPKRSEVQKPLVLWRKKPADKPDVLKKKRKTRSDKGKSHDRTDKITDESIEKAVDFYMKHKKVSMHQALKRVLKNYSGVHCKRFKKLLAAKGGVYVCRRTMKHKNSVSHMAISNDDPRAVRMKWVKARTKVLISQFQYGYERAFRMASDEWQTQKQVKQATKGVEGVKTLASPEVPGKPPFPAFRSIKKDCQKILCDMAVHVAGNRGSFKYKQDGFPLGIDYLAQWKEFCLEFMSKAVDISKSLGVVNAWRVNPENWVISYE